jgi:hypothetical protein
MTAIDKDYYARRAREERQREQAATTPSSAKAHAELAEEYERMLESLDEQRVPPPLAQEQPRA